MALASQVDTIGLQLRLYCNDVPGFTGRYYTTIGLWLGLYCNDVPGFTGRYYRSAVWLVIIVITSLTFV